MSVDSKLILRYVGLMLHVPGTMCVVTLPICLAVGEPEALWPFGGTALISLAAGHALFRLFSVPDEPRLHHGMMIAALGWLAVPVVGAIPFVLLARELHADPTTPATLLELGRAWNALFESFSGFTGTGLTMAVHPSQLPRCIQWWRSFMEWVGGGGVILLMLAVLSHTVGAYNLYHSEGREAKIRPSVVSTVHTIWWIYVTFTSLAVLSLRLVGMSWWEALNHGMTGIATGGFAVTDDSIAGYGPVVKLTVMLIMIVGAMSFAVHYRVLSERRLSVLWGNSQHKSLWTVLALGTVALWVENRWGTGSFQGLDSAFQWVSALGTAGFQTVDIRQWTPTGQLLLSLGMILGGAAGSTAGGLKQVRVAILARGIRWRFRRVRRRPHELVSYELDGTTLAENDAIRVVQDAGMLAWLWAAFLWAGILVLIHVTPAEYTLSEVIFEVSSAQGNVGLSTGITHPSLPWLGKLSLILSMWAGRLEIIPVMILFSSLLRPLKTGRRPGPGGGSIGDDGHSAG